MNLYVKLEVGAVRNILQPKLGISVLTTNPFMQLHFRHAKNYLSSLSSNTSFSRKIVKVLDFLLKKN